MPSVLKRLPALPAERALKVISGRWKTLLLLRLLDGPRRLSELERLVPRIAQKVLIQQLRVMEAHGVVRRHVRAGVPVRVVYSLTPLGRSLEPLIRSLCEWGRRHAAALDETDQLGECLLLPEPEEVG